MKRILRTVCAVALLCRWLPAAERHSSDTSPKPKLVVGIIVDQFRYDYLTRYRSDYQAGFNRLLTQGADFTNAFYAQVPTVTAVGHSLFMSGAMPSVSGIVGNAWYDREEGKLVTSVCDWDVQEVGGRHPEKGPKCTDADPASPKRLLVSTLGDELRLAHQDAKVIGVSLKARAAILPSGHLAQGAFWFDDVTGHFISSTFYMEKLPEWAEKFNALKLPDQYVESKWENFPSWNFHGTPAVPYGKIAASPWGNELVERFAEQALQNEQLGQRGITDLLTVSFSSNDYVGHATGPDSPEVHDMAKRTDVLLGKLFEAIDQKVGLKNTVIVLSADHGAADAPEQGLEKKMPDHYIRNTAIKVATAALNKEYGQRDWMLSDPPEASLYFNRSALKDVKRSDGSLASEAEIYRTARDALFAEPQLHVSRVYTRSQMESGVHGDFIAQAVMYGFFPGRSGDLSVILEPGSVPGSHGTTHFSPYAYDRHVPVLFMGPGIKPGRYDMTIQPNDIAATLATMLDIQTPSGSSGRVLTEMLQH